MIPFVIELNLFNTRASTLHLDTTLLRVAWVTPYSIWLHLLNLALIEKNVKICNPIGSRLFFVGLIVFYDYIFVGKIGLRWYLKIVWYPIMTLSPLKRTLELFPRTQFLDWANNVNWFSIFSFVKYLDLKIKLLTTPFITIFNQIFLWRTSYLFKVLWRGAFTIRMCFRLSDLVDRFILSLIHE